MTDIPKIKLNAGNEIPQLGFSVFQISNHDDAVKVVESAISNGYRLIDTAETYNTKLLLVKQSRIATLTVTTFS